MSLIDRKEFIYRALSLLLLFACVTVAFLTIDDYGMGWDEPTRWNSGDLKVDYYKELVSSEDPLSVVQSVESEDYPGFFDMTLSILHRLTAWDRFALGHWQAFLFGLSGLAALWRIGFIFGGARLGFWSVALMLITPVFYGHWFHNPKDVPFAAMYTIGLLALIELFRDVSRVRKRWLLAASVACGLCMATRVAGMVLLAYAAGALVVLVLSELWHEREEIDLRGLLCRRISWVLSLFVLGVGAYLILMVFWPSSHKNLLPRGRPCNNCMSAPRRFRSFSVVRSCGRRMRLITTHFGCLESRHPKFYFLVCSWQLL